MALILEINILRYQWKPHGADRAFTWLCNVAKVVPYTSLCWEAPPHRSQCMQAACRGAEQSSRASSKDVSIQKICKIRQNRLLTYGYRRGSTFCWVQATEPVLPVWASAVFVHIHIHLSGHQRFTACYLFVAVATSAGCEQPPSKHREAQTTVSSSALSGCHYTTTSVH